MALSSAIVWEIRTDGSQNNGGGFVAGAAGTDYSLLVNDTGKYNATDLVVTHALNTDVTSASHTFVAADVGNIMHITTGAGGWTAGWYEIKSIPSAGVARLDRSPAVIDTASGTYYVGGAFLLGGTLDSDFFYTNQKAAGNTIYIQTGTYTLGETIASGVAGTAALPITVIGYNTTRGDNPTTTDRPLINCGTYEVLIAAYMIWKNISANGSSTNYLFYLVSGATIFSNCKFQNTSTGTGLTAYAGNNDFIGCEFISSGGIAFSTANVVRMLFCYFHDSITGYYGDKINNTLIGCVIETCTTGISIIGSPRFTLINSTIYNCTTGISMTTAYSCVFLNNIISNCTIGVLSSGSNLYQFSSFNCWNNTTDISGTEITIDTINDVIADPAMVNPAAGDFRIGLGSAAADVALDASTYNDCTV